MGFPAITQDVQTINVDMMSSGTVYSGTAAAPDSGARWNSISAAGTLSTVYDSQTNVVSGVAIAFASSGTVHIYNDTTTGSPNPSALMSAYTYGATYTLTVTGLAVNQPYGLYAYSHGNVDNQTDTITLVAGNGGSLASTSQTGDSSNFRNIYMYGRGFNYVVLNGTADSSGTFTFTVVNYLNGFQLQRLAAPVITGLTNQTVIAAATATLSPTITGIPIPSYQWRSNSMAITGQTNASLTLNYVQYAQNNTAHSPVASNYVSVVTNSMTLTVIVTPSITSLNNQAVSTGSTVTMPATVSGVPTPATRWQLKGTNLSDGATGNGSTISGSATSTLVINNAQAADSGNYSLVATNSAGMVTNITTLTVSSGNVAPSIVGPTDQTVVQSNNATFTTSASGLPVPTLQWRLNGANIPGSTDSSLTITNAQYSQNGFVYSLVASNIAGMATNSATLYVLVPPSISQQPTNITVAVGNSATFSVTASGMPAVSYQWNRNGSPIANATDPSYSVSNAQGADNSAVFSVTVSNSVGNVTSSNAKLTVLSTMTGTFLPTNGAVNISPDQQLRIIFSSTPIIGSGKLYVRDAANDSLFATIDTSLFQTYSMFSATITNAFIRSVQGSSFFYQPVAIYGNEAWITLTNRFAYNKTYYVNADAGLFRDTANASFPAITGTNAWRFSTKSAGPATPTASTGPTNITVGLDGAGDFATLQCASDWIPQNNTLKRTITVQPGKYRDFTIFAQSRNNVQIIGGGTNRQDVQFIYLYPAYSSANGAGTLRLESSDIYVRNLTVDNQVYFTNNGVVFAGPIQTVQTTGNRLIFDNLLIKGGQDTLYTISGITYFNHCEIWGSVDYIYGAALSVFDQCNIVEIRSSGGPCTAPNTDLASPYGMVFLNCTFPRALIANGYPYDVGVGTTTFMRPWRQDGATAIINCVVDSQISTKGWLEWPPGDTETTCRTRESGTTLIGGGSVTPAQRQAAGAYWLNTIDPDYANNPSLNPTNALLYGSGGTNNRVAVTVDTNNYTLSAIFGNSYFNLNGWMPTVIPTITTQPASQTISNGATATFATAATGLPSPSFQWLKNGTNFSNATNATLTITNAQAGDAGTYSVIVSNSAGVLVSSNALLSVVIPVNTTPTNIVTGITGNALQLSWPADHLGWRLQYQTNAMSQGLGTNWIDWPNSTNVYQTNIVINPLPGTTFFRLIYP